MKLSLPNSIASQQDLKAAVLEIRQYARWFSQGEVKKRVSGKEPQQQPVLSETSAALIEQCSQPLSQKTLDELIAGLESLDAKAPHLTITLAAPAPGNLQQTIVKWCRQNIHPNTLVNFKFNATILGGMVISCGSRVFDLSFRREILAARSHFAEVLRNV